MISGIGVDIIEIARISGVMQRHGKKFIDRVYNPEEFAGSKIEKKGLIEQNSPGYTSYIQHIAGKFAAKEAFLKALGTGLAHGITWLDVSVLSNASGAPELRLSGKAAELAKSRGVQKIFVSISHSNENVVAFVVFECA